MQPTKLPTRIKNFLYRETEQRSPLWIRPSEAKYLDIPRPIVLVNGAFDLMHINHIRLINAARHKAATLVCALDSDTKISREKGPERPILTYEERAALLAYMPLDIICEIADDRDMNTLMHGLAPDLRVQGESYRGKSSRYSVPKMFVRESTLHTTELITRILKAYGH